MLGFPFSDWLIALCIAVPAAFAYIGLIHLIIWMRWLPRERERQREDREFEEQLRQRLLELSNRRQP